MNSPTQRVADQAIAKLEEEEAGDAIADVKNAKEDTKDDTKATDAGADKQATGEETADKSGDKGTDTKPAGDDAGTADKPDEEEGEFTADDALEVEDKADDTPPAPTDNAGTQLSPAEQEYVVKNIGEPIIIQGYKLDKDGAEVPYEVKAYVPEQIPKDFNFASQADLLQAQAAFVRLDQKANQLLGTFRNEQSQSVQADFDRRENEGIRADVSDLQKDGRFPKFKVQPGAQGFDETPEAKQMADVLKVMAELNDMYFKQYQQGRPYKHIGFSEAFDRWERTNPERKAARAEDEAQDKEDKARSKTAERGSTNRGTDAGNIRKADVRSGTTTRDLLAWIDSEL